LVRIHTVLNDNLRSIPPHKIHGTNWLGDILLRVIPIIPIPVHPAGIKAIDMNMVSRDSQSSMMILKEDRVRIIAIPPISQVRRKRPDTAPLNVHVVQHGIQPLGYPIVLVFRKNHCSAIIALVESSEDVRYVVSFRSKGFNSALLSILRGPARIAAEFVAGEKRRC
jgi:hypothetical protein